MQVKPDRQNIARRDDNRSAATSISQLKQHPTPVDREITRALAPYLRANIFPEVGELPAILAAYRAEMLARVRAA